MDRKWPTYYRILSHHFCADCFATPENIVLSTSANFSTTNILRKPLVLYDQFIYISRVVVLELFQWKDADETNKSYQSERYVENYQYANREEFYRRIILQYSTKTGPVLNFSWSFFLAIQWCTTYVFCRYQVGLYNKASYIKCNHLTVHILLSKYPSLFSGDRSEHHQKVNRTNWLMRRNQKRVTVILSWYFP